MPKPKIRLGQGSGGERGEGEGGGGGGYMELVSYILVAGIAHFHSNRRGQQNHQKKKTKEYTNIMMQPRLVILGLIGLTVVGMCHAQGRIMGGDDADATATTYAASLRVDNAHVCGASILSQTKILTTAHCVHRDGKLIDASRLSCRVGSTNQYAGGKIVSVESVAVHPDYYNLNNNLAVITLSSALTYTDRITAIPVVASGEALPAEGSEVSVAGWGRTTDGTNSYKIREISLKVAPEATCLDAYSDHGEQSFCLAHELKEGTCHGDGGGGAVYGDKLIGLTNFVVGACGSRYPDVFVRLSSYADWIQEQIA